MRNLQGKIPRQTGIRAKSGLRKLRKEFDGIEPEVLEAEFAFKSTKLPKNWKDICSRILNRDGHVCAFCESADRLVVHHMDGNEKNNKKNNLITVCPSCHDKFPVPPFSERFYCKTIWSEAKSICVRLGYRAGNLSAKNCELFSSKHGCLLEPIQVIKEKNNG